MDDETGQRYGKANADLDLAVDMLIQSEHLDKVVLVTGDGDFVNVVKASQNNGCRVEVIGFDNISGSLKEEADQFISGYLIPNLLPPESEVSWGQIGSVVRGLCSFHNREKNFGYMRFLKVISPNLWLTDNQNPESPYGSAYFRDGSFVNFKPAEQLPSYNHIFQFELKPPFKEDQCPVASNIRLIGVLPS